MFEKEYFIHSKTSNYEDYRKKKFGILAEDLIGLIPLEKNTKILDFGCATGGLIKELLDRGFSNIKGTDISYYAIKYGKEILGLKKELEYYNLNLLASEFDVIFLLDILEHVPTEDELNKLLGMNQTPLVIIRLPISKVEGQPYAFEVSRNDPTHVICHTRGWWIRLFSNHQYMLKKFLYGKSIFDSEGVLAGLFWRKK